MSRLGSGALFSNTTGDFNLAVGTEALANSNGTFNLAIGFRTLFLNNTDSRLTAIGAAALRKNGSVRSVIQEPTE